MADKWLSKSEATELLVSMRQFHSKLVSTIELYESILASWPDDAVKVCFDLGDDNV